MRVVLDHRHERVLVVAQEVTERPAERRATSDEAIALYLAVVRMTLVPLASTTKPQPSREQVRGTLSLTTQPSDLVD